MKMIGPRLAVDIIIQVGGSQNVVLIKRKNPPIGWALPGGFVDYGENVEQAAVREAKEETSLDIELIRQFHVYSDPKRDARFHTASVVFIARATGTPVANDDAAEIAIFGKGKLPEDLMFDHGQILDDYFSMKY
jgi:ADP-ribose pyrophosphatase YjhB (NUDIX family)